MPESTMSFDDVNRLLIRLRQVIKKRERREATFKATNQRRLERFNERSAPDLIEEAEIIQALTDQLTPQRDELIREFGKIIELDQGTVKWLNRPETVELPKNLDEIVAVLRLQPDGHQALERVWQVVKKAITGLSDETKDALRTYGAKIGRREDLTVKPKGLSKPITVDTRELSESEERSTR